MFVHIWEDKHVETQVKLFNDFDTAYMYAKDACEDAYYDYFIEVNYKLDDVMKQNGWLFYAGAEDLFDMWIIEMQPV